ncbi:unnamed protein product [Blepharisma stoltei]|uniref:Uncharacterized protein n=1 Tax=Blepharisma stoltei TaxID=1481888 RepID=A0AAU9K471_9CILI|nr:unnamed protein product [Blepharisma stoltei]
MSTSDTDEDICMKKAEKEFKLYRNKRKIQKMLDEYNSQLVSQRENNLQYEWSGDGLEIFLAQSDFDKELSSIAISQNIYEAYNPKNPYHSGEDSHTEISENTNAEEEMSIKATDDTNRKQMIALL